MWKCTNPDIYITKPTLKKQKSTIRNSYHFTITNYKGKESAKIILLKRLPKKYIPELFE